MVGRLEDLPVFMQFIMYLLRKKDYLSVQTLGANINCCIGHWKHISLISLFCDSPIKCFLWRGKRNNDSPEIQDEHFAYRWAHGSRRYPPILGMPSYRNYVQNIMFSIKGKFFSFPTFFIIFSCVVSDKPFLLRVFSSSRGNFYPLW